MPRWSLILAYVIVTLTFMVTANWSHDASVKATHSSATAQALAERLDRDAKRRITESCLNSKTRYIAAVQSLKRTYDLLEQSTPAENRSTINKAVRSGLDRQEQDLVGLRPASFCKNIGPKIPPTPDRPINIR